MATNHGSSPATLADTTSREPSRWRELVTLLIGRPLATSEGPRHELGPWLGVPALGLDAICSSAYGPEAALTILLPLGVAGVSYIVPITAVIVVLSAIVYFSYRQTIAAYPSGGGSYTVASQNLGPTLGRVAAAALGCDYVLNVAVGISAGVGALVSALPSLLPHRLPLCLAMLVLLVIVNLRGTREAGLAFTLPTYLFVVTLLSVIVLGTWHTLASGGHPVAVVRPPALPPAVETATWWLALRAFASGCTALTGIEAVSNGVTAFREPRIRNARRTLALIVGILIALLAGFAFLCRAYGVGATSPEAPGFQSVLSQLTAAVVGRGAFYHLTLGAIVTTLCLSANTSFADFPRLCSVLAHDRHLPDMFLWRGRRLVFSSGIVFLGLLSGMLLLVFGGVTDRLIPLFAVGAFVAFTLSQAGMVVHTHRERGPAHRRHLAINAAGALATGATALVVSVTKFSQGAWIAVLAIALMSVVFGRIHGHYTTTARELSHVAPLDPAAPPEPFVIVPVQAWDELAGRGLRFARRLSDEIHALHVIPEDSSAEELTRAWEEQVAAPARAAGARVPELVLRRSRYREFFTPIVEYVNAARARSPERDVVVVIPGVVPRRWYQALLHNERGALLKALLRARAPERVVIVSVPLHLTR